ncbi:MAG: RNA 2',3'-cyclic phosphodiesterase [Gemmatimonadales bacterium]|nr:MAG: RNA 2',3'-cyclic phosphodiesterase [Gemmatimonadales bacterium]
MRLFIALNIPDSERDRIHEAAQPLREAAFPVRWLDPENFHLTLKFLGNLDPDRLPIIEKVVKRVADATRAFPLVIEGFGAFPTIRRPEVLWVGAEPSPALRCLKQDLEWGLASHGFGRETRAFHPHLTVGRSSVDEGAGAFRGLDELAAGIEYSGTVEVRTVDIMRSHLSREGARYTTLARVPLLSDPSGDE